MLKNLLPYDGQVTYKCQLLSKQQADLYYEPLLSTIEWQHDEAMMFGKKIVTKRKVAWYAEKPFSYTYSRVTKTAKLWTKELLELLEITTNTCGETFNSCLLNLYHDGSEGMAWHSDGEKELKKHGTVASLSLGAERKFAFKHKDSRERIDVWLEHGSLLLMQKETQDHWLHRLPPTKKVSTPRINLTFRTINYDK